MSFCANCGTKLYDGQDFCPDCGTAVREGAAAAADTGPVPVTPTVLAPVAAFPAKSPPASSSTDSQDGEVALQKLATLRTQNPPPAKNTGKKILIAFLLVVLLGGAAAAAGAIYLTYRVKQKASAALNRLEGKTDTSSENSVETTSDNTKHSDSGNHGRDKSDPLSSLIGKLQGGDQSSSTGNAVTGILEDLGVENPGMPKDLVRNIPYAAVKTPLPCPTGADINPAKLANGRIQIKPGTILTNSWSLPKGDAESDEKIQSVSPERLQFQFDGIAAHNLAKGDDRKHVIFDNTVCGKDVAAGEAFATGWYFDKHEVTPGLYPGLSRIFLPAARFANLKSTGSLSLVFGWYDYMDVLTEWELLAWKGKLTRVEQDDVPFPLIINDEPVNVPAIHVRGPMKVLETAGRFGSQDQPAEAYILDDPNSPIVLSWLFGKDLHQDDAFRVQYIRVRYPGSDRPTIAQQLAKNCKAITWGINFDFNSDVIRPESEPVVKEIADAITHQPDWKLTIVGHTDNIGGHKYNLGLSQRRAASLKRALVEQYHVDPNLLSTVGDGDSDPIDTNDTLEGRARNRRVELSCN